MEDDFAERLWLYGGTAIGAALLGMDVGGSWGAGVGVLFALVLVRSRRRPAAREE